MTAPDDINDIEAAARRLRLAGEHLESSPQLRGLELHEATLELEDALAAVIGMAERIAERLQIATQRRNDQTQG